MIKSLILASALAITLAAPASAAWTTDGNGNLCTDVDAFGRELSEPHCFVGGGSKSSKWTTRPAPAPVPATPVVVVPGETCVDVTVRVWEPRYIYIPGIGHIQVGGHWVDRTEEQCTPNT